MNKNEMLRHLNDVNGKNGIAVCSVEEDIFASYGRVLSGIDFSEMIRVMEDRTEIPENGNRYVASFDALEKCAVMGQVKSEVYGGMEIQAGFCNGRNTTFNGFEFHKGSEINVAVTDFMLVLGHTWDIDMEAEPHPVYDSNLAQVFFVPKGTAIEMHQTTLHLSPCRVCDEGFKGIVILPRGTNTPLAEKPAPATKEGMLLLQKNKWVLSHPDREPLIKQGAVPGMLGENRELVY